MKLLTRKTKSWRTTGYISTFLLPALAGVLMLFLAMTSHQHKLQQRWHLQSAADAMAHSAATIMAREFNILAVLNRSLIANQVAQAQLLGLSSWYRTIASATNRLALVTSWIPYVNVVAGQLSRVVTTINRPLQGMIKVGLALQQSLIMAIHATQMTVRFSFAQIIPETLAELANIQQIQTHEWSLVHSPGLVDFPWLWWTFIPPKSVTNDDGKFAKLVNDSRDPFSKKRSYHWFKIGIIKAAKAGGAELVRERNGHWSWQSLDTVALHLKILFYRKEIPWGNGATFRGRKITRAKRNNFGGSRRTNPSTTSWALKTQYKMGGFNNPRYFDRTNLERSTWPSIIVIFDEVIAKAGIEYSRPLTIFPRVDKKPEKANLYNALWEPKLQPLSVQEKSVISLFKQAEAS